MDLSPPQIVGIAILWWIVGLIGYFNGAQNMFKEDREYTVFSEFLAGRELSPWRLLLLSFLGPFLILTNHITWKD